MLVFFWKHKEQGKIYTFPVANVCMDAGGLGDIPKKYILEWTNGKGLENGKIKMSCNQNGSKQFMGKNVSTLVIDSAGKAYVTECNSPPRDCKYAVSGMPVIRNGADVSWTKFVLPQGWFVDPARATYRNWLGIKGDIMYLISGATRTSNYIAKSEIYNKVKLLGLSDLLGFDGGGSYFATIGGKTMNTSENRQVNSIGVIG